VTPGRSSAQSRPGSISVYHAVGAEASIRRLGDLSIDFPESQVVGEDAEGITEDDDEIDYMAPSIIGEQSTPHPSRLLIIYPLPRYRIRATVYRTHYKAVGRTLFNLTQSYPLDDSTPITTMATQTPSVHWSNGTC
jgi:hypothetical protein